jgi:hypothetical protein
MPLNVAEPFDGVVAAGSANALRTVDETRVAREKA